MKNIILMGLGAAVIAVLLIGLPARPSLAVDQATLEECEETVLKLGKKISKTKDRIRKKFAKFLSLTVDCELLGKFSPEKCDKKENKLIRQVENLTNTLDKQIDKFDEKVFVKLPECGDLLDDLGVDESNLF